MFHLLYYVYHRYCFVKWKIWNFSHISTTHSVLIMFRTDYSTCTYIQNTFSMCLYVFKHKLLASSIVSRQNIHNIIVCNICCIVFRQNKLYIRQYMKQYLLNLLMRRAI